MGVLVGQPAAVLASRVLVLVFWAVVMRWVRRRRRLGTGWCRAVGGGCWIGAGGLSNRGVACCPNPCYVRLVLVVCAEVFALHSQPKPPVLGVQL